MTTFTVIGRLRKVEVQATVTAANAPAALKEFAIKYPHHRVVYLYDDTNREQIFSMKD